MILLRALAGLLGHLPGFTFVYIEHAGDVHQHVCPPVDDDCDCDCGECATAPDLNHLPAMTVYQLAEPTLRELLEEVATAKGNGASVDEAVDHGIATLVLTNIEAAGPDA